MTTTDAIAWPSSYRSLLLAIGLCGAAAAVLAAWNGSVAAWPLVATGAVVALGCFATRRHMARRPMLAIEGGRLLCRRAGSRSGRSANLLQEHAYPLDTIEAIEREVQPWPGAGGERHLYTVLIKDGPAYPLVPRPSAPALRADMAAFFERHFAGRVREQRIG